ncbi:hypothetical protein CsSME_00022781 [Camellia sinensis var. sinensis]
MARGGCWRLEEVGTCVEVVGGGQSRGDWPEVVVGGGGQKYGWPEVVLRGRGGEIEDDKVNEFEVWHGLANLYSSLSHWKDAEICLEKARALFEYSAEMMHTEDALQTFNWDAIASILRYLKSAPDCGLLCQNHGHN